MSDDALLRPLLVLDAVTALLRRLREVRDPHALELRFCRDAAAACDFTRVMISRVEGGVWRPWVVSFATDPAFDRHFSTQLRGVRIPLAADSAESLAMRERRPVIVEGSVPLPLEGLTSAYVVMPLTGTSGVFGLVHADHDRADPPRALGDEDRDALWLLADGFARLYERAVLEERLRVQQARLRDALERAQGDGARIAAADPGVLQEPRSDRAAISARIAGVRSPFTPRERDVAGLVAQGFSNAAIARELVLVEGTVKTHVKKILKKLGAANRPEAIAILLGHAPNG